MIPPGLEPGTLCVLGTRDNHYTTESRMLDHDKVQRQLNHGADIHFVSLLCKYVQYVDCADCEWVHVIE